MVQRREVPNIFEDELVITRKVTSGRQVRVSKVGDPTMESSMFGERWSYDSWKLPFLVQQAEPPKPRRSTSFAMSCHEAEDLKVLPMPTVGAERCTATRNFDKMKMAQSDDDKKLLNISHHFFPDFEKRIMLGVRTSARHQA